MSYLPYSFQFRERNLFTKTRCCTLNCLRNHQKETATQQLSTILTGSCYSKPTDFYLHEAKEQHLSIKKKKKRHLSKMMR